MTVSPLERLPPELFATIIDELSLHDQSRLSRTNSAIRAKTAPAVFRSLKVDCPLREGHVGEDVIKKFGHHVLRLHIYVPFFPNKAKDEEEEQDTESEEEEMSVDEDGGEKEDEQEEDGEDEEEVEDEEDEDYEKLKMACLPNMFPPPTTKDAAEEEDGEEKAVEGQEDDDDDDEPEEEEEEEEEKWYWTNPPESVWAHKATDAKFVQDLIQFKGLPRCAILGLHTDGDDDFEVYGDWDDNDIGNDSIYFCCEPENWEEVKTKEEKYAWRAALREMYHDVAKLSRVEDLRIYNFLPRKASSWQTTEWGEFLGRLRILRLYPYGGDNGAGWQVNTLPGFNAFFDELSTTVFRHVNALQSLRIVGHEDGFLDCDSLRLSPGIMPELRVLHVEYMAAPSILTHFLTQEPPALEEIHIVNCVAQDMSRDGDTQPTWAQLWKTLRQLPIRVVYKQAKTAQLTFDEDFHEGDEKWVPPDDEEENVKQSRKKLKDDPSLIVWPYGGPDDKYGNLSMDVDMDLENFEKGEDNREYALLLADMQQDKQEVLMRQAWWKLVTE
ncbi:hypothetical protein NW762_008008 [Fusarium torreyae]|uniref:F-box domain-containing protein n=1 Tax=Fusarium torreyae TaxID=1237075 RepID=A0A9W8RWU4_9HYPO|nr:hypothetical protein NW762_008008 [Fusarium torreyae]